MISPDEKTSLLLRNGQIYTDKGWKKGSVSIREGIVDDISLKKDDPIPSAGDLDVLDCQDFMIIPALYDSHMHVLDWGLRSIALDLSSCRSSDEIISRIVDVLEGSVPNTLYERCGTLLALDYDDSDFREPFEPTLSELDGLTDGPLMVRRVCGHLGFCNSSFIEGLRENGMNGFDGRVNDDIGIDILHRIDLDPYMFDIALRKAVEGLWSMGVVGGVEIISSNRLDMFLETFMEMGTPLDLSISIIPENDENGLERALGKFEEYHDIRNGRPRSMFVKAFTDGSIGARTASFTFPYDNGSYSRPQMRKDEIASFVNECHTNGAIPMLHAIGDSSLDEVIKGCKGMELPVRVEHLEKVRKDQVDALIGSSIIACMQPNFQDRWGRFGGLYEKRLGRAYKDLNPYGVIARSGVPLVFGTDMMPPGPLNGIKGVTEHPDPNSRMSFQDAISRFSYRTIESSFITSDPKSIRIGKECNLLVVNNKTKAHFMSVIKGKIIKKDITCVTR